MRRRFSIFIYFVTVAILAVVQTSFFPEFIIWKIKPDLVLLFAISAGLLKGYREGALVGIIGGVMTGLVSWNPWGIYILGYSLAGFIAGALTEKIEPDNIVVPLISSVIGSIIFTVVLVSISLIFEFFNLEITDLYNMLYFAIWNAVFMLPVYFISRYVLIPPGRELDLSGALKGSNYTIQ
ncbi:MAG: rod shape-determining protein MreD [Firmicutes bacterium]|nr:rod shape-determining protein MreD [Bacillota bacterium]